MLASRWKKKGIGRFEVALLTAKPSGIRTIKALLRNAEIIDGERSRTTWPPALPEGRTKPTAGISNVRSGSRREIAATSSATRGSGGYEFMAHYLHKVK
jgi:hypothetical protein